ncbi:LptF/LptG family permease [Psychrilyobacter atlanticus]|uniref:LptF/LptG family permease n=1 Tax=Psychrilyobacter atlanticus TaxID=271091 RepID=UPI000419B198|nr:LptF/LptG family permease [Psychrilyobacter atlanticus]
MKKIDRYIIVKFIKSVLLSLFAFIGIFVLSQIFKVINYVTSGRMTSIEGAKYMAALVPGILVQVSPLAALLGGLITINKMASSLEVIALKTSGISFRRIVLLPIIATFIMAGGVFYISNSLQPEGLKVARELKRKNQIDEDQIPVEKSNVYLRGNGDYIYHFDYINREENIAKGVEVVILNKNFDAIKSIITAKSARYTDGGRWELDRANENKIDEKKVVFHKTYTNLQLKDEPKLFLTPKYRKEELSLTELKRIALLLRKTGGEAKEFDVEFHKRIAYPFACVVIGILGLALGSRYVRGSSAINIALSIAFGYGYYIVQASFEAVAMGGILSPLIGAWMPNLIFIGIGLVAMNKAEY